MRKIHELIMKAHREIPGLKDEDLLILIPRQEVWKGMRETADIYRRSEPLVGQKFEDAVDKIRFIYGIKISKDWDGEITLVHMEKSWKISELTKREDYRD